MKKFLPIVIVIIAAVAVLFILFRNKEKIGESTKLSLARVEVRPVRAIRVGPLKEVFLDTYYGQLAASSELMLMASTQGMVTNVAVEKGQSVRQGQVIASVENKLLREQLDVSKSAYEKLKKDMERYRVMLENDAITRQQFETLELNYKGAEAKYAAALKQFNDTQITSPINGVVNQLFVKKGGMIGPGVPVCEIVNPGNLIIRLKLSQQESARLNEAHTIKVLINDHDSVNTRIGFRSVKPDYSGLYEVDLIPERELVNYTAGTSVRIISESTPSASDIYLPQKTLLGYGGTQLYVYTAENGRAVRRNVETGSTMGDYIKITSGLTVGDSVITDGNTIVADGDKISVKPG